MKKFNVTGCCFPEDHYMVDTMSQLEQTTALIDAGEYFTICRPRQYGKTTMLESLTNTLDQTRYIVFQLSFEGIGDSVFDSENAFCMTFFEMLAEAKEHTNPDIAAQIKKLLPAVQNLKTLSKTITDLAINLSKGMVLLIDEVDKSSNNQLFVSFLGMLRDKFLKRKREATFKSVVLTGVHDVKSLKMKVRADEELKFNSPWNIAAEFDVDLSFSPQEIATMLLQYSGDKRVAMDIESISERLFYYTNGHPFLVSSLCKIIDEKAVKQNPEYNPQNWTLDEIDWSFRTITREDYTTTNFTELIKNLEANPELFDIAYNVVICGADLVASFDNPIVNLGFTYGLFISQCGKIKIANRIYEQRLYNYMVSKRETAQFGEKRFSKSQFLNDDDSLDFKKVLLKFQEFMKEHYSNKDDVFLERHGRLLFMSHLKPIINGEGFDFKEPVTGDERRIDLAVTFRNQRYVIEMKRWEGDKAHQRGLQQLSDYLDNYNLKNGYLLIFDFRSQKEYISKQIRFKDKDIFTVWV